MSLGGLGGLVRSPTVSCSHQGGKPEALLPPSKPRCQRWLTLLMFSGRANQSLVGAIVAAIRVPGHCSGDPLSPRLDVLSTYTLKFLDIVVGEYVCFLQVLVRVQGLAHQCFPEGGQEVQRQRDICSNCNSQQLPQEVQQLLLPIGDGAGGQDVLALDMEAEAR